MDTVSRAEIGQRVRARRLALGLTQEQLAESAELDQGYVSAIELGHRTPSLGTLSRIASALGLTPPELLPQGHVA